MADRFPLILNTSANQIQEIASGDTLDLTDVNISNAGVITATSFAGDGSGLIGVASTDNIVTGTAATFNTFPIDINAGMDVAGVSTFASDIGIGRSIFHDGDTHTTVGFGNNNVRFHTSGEERFNINDSSNSFYNYTSVNYTNSSNNSPSFHVRNNTQSYHTIIEYQNTNARSSIIQWNDTGSTATAGNLIFRSRNSPYEEHARFTGAGNFNLLKDLDVDGHTNLDNVSVAGVATFSGNVSIGGTLTYEDVTNIDSVGVITAREGIFIPDSKKLHIGNTSGSGDLQIFHDTNNSTIEDTGTGNLYIKSDSVISIRGTTVAIKSADNTQVLIKGVENAGSELYFNNNLKFITTNTGAIVTGILTATSFEGDGSNLTGVGISTEQVTPSSNVATLDLTKNEHKIVASGTYTIDVNGGTEADSHVIRIENSGISTVGFSTYFKFPSGGTPALPTASGAISLISFTVHKVGSVGIATVLLAGASVNFS